MLWNRTKKFLAAVLTPSLLCLKKNKKRKERKEEGDRKEGREKGKEGRKEGGNYSSCGKECKDHVDPIRVEINILVSL